MKRILAGLALALLIAGPVMAAPKVASGSLVITSDLVGVAFGDAVTFSATTDNLKGYQYPLVYLACYQSGVLVYGQLDLPTATFILGGGSSLWHQSPGPADCSAKLYAYPGVHHNDPIILLDGPLTFAAAG